MTAFDGYFEPPASFSSFLSGAPNQDGYFYPLVFTRFDALCSILGQPSVTNSIFYFLTAQCSIGPTTLFWVDKQPSILNAPSCGGTITGLTVLGIYKSG